MVFTILFFNVTSFDDANAVTESTFGSKGYGNGELNSPLGVAVDSKDRIIVADTNNHRIQIFDSDGNFVSSFGSLGSGDGRFDSPSGVATDSNDRIIVADYDNHRVQIFDSDGNFVSSFDITHVGHNNFGTASDVAVDSNDRIIVAEANNHRIQVFDSDGTHQLTIDNDIFDPNDRRVDRDQIGNPAGVAVDSNDRIIVADGVIHRIHVFDSDGNFVSSFGSYIHPIGDFGHIADVAINSNDQIIATDSRNHRIHVFDSDGNFVSKFGGTDYGEEKLNRPNSVAVDSKDRMIVTFARTNEIKILTGSDSETVFTNTKYPEIFDRFTGLATTRDEGIQYTTSLRVPEVTVDTTKFADTKEIILDVEFKNTQGNDYSGLWWNIYDPNSKTTPEILLYERLKNERTFTIIIKEVPIPYSKQLEIGEVNVYSDDEFVNLMGQPDSSAFKIGISDIDESVECVIDHTPSIKTKLRVSSPAFSPGGTYQIRVLAGGSFAEYYQKITIPSEFTQSENKNDSTTTTTDLSQLIESKLCIDDDIKRQISFAEPTEKNEGSSESNKTKDNLKGLVDWIMALFGL